MKGTNWKRIWAVLLSAVLVCMLAGCGKGTESGSADASSEPESSGSAAEGEVLSITVGNLYQRTFEIAKKQFELTHPGVTVELDIYDTLGEAEEVQAKCEEIGRNAMLGKGEDIVVADSTFVQYNDLFKICKAGAFEDLNSYFDADESWSWDNYNTAVIDGYEFAGKQYMMPLYYDIPVLVSERSALEAAGFDLDSCKNGLEYLEQYAAYLKRAEQDAALPKGANLNAQFCLQVWDQLQLEPFGIGSPDEVKWDGNIQQYAERFKVYFEADSCADPDFNMPDMSHEGEQIVNGEILFGDMRYGDRLEKQFAIISEILKYDGEPVLHPFTAMDGESVSAQINLAVGISNTSTHKQLAYEFIKCLMGEEAQLAKSETGGSSAANGMSVYEPVLSQILALNGVSLRVSVQREDGSWSDGDVEAYLEQYKEISHQVTHGYSYVYGDTAYFYLRKYFNGEMSYEDAFDKADSMLKRYISE